jgi:hypothetical protein
VPIDAPQDHPVDRHRDHDDRRPSPMLRFAPRYGLISPCLRRPAPRPKTPANDNGRDERAGTPPAACPADRLTAMTRPRAAASLAAASLAPDGLIATALRLFASHGHGAAQHAANRATHAAARNDHDDARWWADVCHTLDRREGMALRRVLGR